MLINWLTRMAPMLEADNGGTSGERPRSADLLAQYNGDVVRMADKLADVLHDNHSLREKRNALQTQVDALTPKVPADGTVVLSATDAARWAAYQSLGKPDELATRIQEGDTARQERDTLQRRDTLRTVAETTGYKPSVLERLLGDLPTELQDVQVTKDGKVETVKQAVVRDGDKTTPLTDYAAANWGDFLPALTQTVAPPAPSGPRYVPQTSGPGTTGDPVQAAIDAMQAARDARGPNPLKP